MAEEEIVENAETEHDRRTKYRKLREAGKSDSEAREEVWPSTSRGMKRNADEKARLEAGKAEGKDAASEGA